MWLGNPCSCTTWTEWADDLWPVIKDAVSALIGMGLTCGDAAPVAGVATSETLRLHMIEKSSSGVARRAGHDGMTVERCVIRPSLTVGDE